MTLILYLSLIVELVVSLDSTQNYRELKTHRLMSLPKLLVISSTWEIMLLQCFHTLTYYNLPDTLLLNTVEVQL